MSQTKESGCTVVGNTPVQCYNLPIERGLYNTAKIGANLETCKCLPTESVERTGCIISQAKEAGTTTDGNDPAQCYNLPIELGANDTGKVDAMDFNTCHCVPIESGGAKVTDLDECKCVPTESVEKTIRIMSLTKESGTTMVKLDTCKCLPAESVKLDTCKCVSTDSVKLDNCKCVPTESVERTGCIMSQANEAGSTTQVGNAPVQCYNLPIEVGEKAGKKMMDLDACKCVPTESVERTGCIMSQAAEGESTMEAKIDKWPVQCYNLPTEGADNTLYSMPQHKDHIVASVQYQTMPQIQDINMDCAPSQSRNNKDITYAPNSKENDAPAAFEISEEYPAKYIRHVSTSRSIVTPKSECIQEQVITDSEMFEKALYEITISSEMDQMKGTEVRLSSTNIKFSEYEQLEEQQRGTETNDMKSFSVKSSSSVGEADCDIVKCSIFTEGSTCCPSEQQKQCNRNRKKLKKKRHEKLQLSSHPKNDFNFAINFAEDILALIEKQFKYLISEEDSEKLMSKSSSKHISSKLRNLIDTYDATASSNANNQLNNVDKAEKSRQNNFDEQSIDSSKKCACKIESNFTTKKLCPAQANVKKNQFEKGESNQLNKVNETVLDTCISSEASKSKRKPALKPTSGSYPHHIVVNNKSFYSSCRTQLPLFLRDMSSH